MSMDREKIARVIAGSYSRYGLPASAVEFMQSSLAAADAVIAEMDRWLPIETAPKDRTSVLVCDVKSPYPQANIAQWREYDRGIMSWRTYGGGLVLPTHWRPLPAPPKENQ